MARKLANVAWPVVFVARCVFRSGSAFWDRPDGHGFVFPRRSPVSRARKANSKIPFELNPAIPAAVGRRDLIGRTHHVPCAGPPRGEQAVDAGITMAEALE